MKKSMLSHWTLNQQIAKTSSDKLHMHSTTLMTTKQKATVCQACGVTGYSNLLVYCVQCQVSAEHRYCLDKLPKTKDEEVIWECDLCIPKVEKLSSRKNCLSLKNDRADETRKKEKKKISWSVPVAEMGKCETFPPLKLNQEKHTSANELETVQLADYFSDPITDSSVYFHDENGKGNQKFKKRRRLILEDENSSEEEAACVDQKFKKQSRLILEDENSSEEVAACVKAKPSEVALDGPSKISCHQPSTYFNDFAHVRPIIDPVWRGCFSIYNEKYGAVAGLSAHLSNKACLKVCDGANALPPLLGFELLPRFDAWPKSFYRSLPSDNNIALYFFPETERDEKFYDFLLLDMIEKDLALKAVIDDAELLVFSSNQLPQDYRRFHGKYYLWGVFKAKQVPAFRKSNENILVQSSKAKHELPLKSANEMLSQDEKFVSKMTRTGSPLSTLSTSSSYRSDSSHSPLHHKSIFHSSEMVSSQFSGRFRPGHTEKSSDIEGYMENQHRNREEECRRTCNVMFPLVEAQMSFPFGIHNVTASSKPCLNLFPLEAENIAIVTSGKTNNGLDLELQLGWPTNNDGGGWSPRCNKHLGKSCTLAIEKAVF